MDRSTPIRYKYINNTKKMENPMIPIPSYQSRVTATPPVPALYPQRAMRDQPLVRSHGR